MAGDDPRDVHWKQTARMRRWIVREREAERDRVVVLSVENALPDVEDPDALATFETAIARCAGQMLFLLSRGGDVGFHARGVRVPAASGPLQRKRILEALGRLEAIPAAGAPELPPLKRGETRVAVSG